MNATATATTDTGMAFYRHPSDGTICWTYDTDHTGMHWRAPRPEERPGITHCLRRHDNPSWVEPLPDEHARRLLSPDSGRAALADRIFATLDHYFVAITPVDAGERRPPVSARALAIEIADQIVLDGYRQAENQHH